MRRPGPAGSGDPRQSPPAGVGGGGPHAVGHNRLHQLGDASAEGIVGGEGVGQETAVHDGLDMLAEATGPGSNPAGGHAQAIHAAAVSAICCGMTPRLSRRIAGSGMRSRSLDEPSEPTREVLSPRATFVHLSKSRAM